LATVPVPKHFRVVSESGKFHERFGEMLNSSAAG
jgi:hypothetical protein